MYGKKKSPVEKRSCYKMTPKSPILRALEEEGKPRLAVKKKATKRNQVEVPRIGVKKKVTAPTKYMNKKTKNNKPCPGCGTICPSCRGKK